MNVWRYEYGDYEITVKRLGEDEIEVFVGYWMDGQEIRLPSEVASGLAEFLSGEIKT